MKQWTHKHTLLTIAVLAAGGYIYYKWETSAKDKTNDATTTPTATGATTAFTGGTPYYAADGSTHKNFVTPADNNRGYGNGYNTNMTNQQFYNRH